MEKFKILNEWFTLDKDKGLYTRYALIKPYTDGGEESIIRLTVDSGEFTNTLRNGYHKHIKTNQRTSK